MECYKQIKSRSEIPALRRCHYRADLLTAWNLDAQAWSYFDPSPSPVWVVYLVASIGSQFYHGCTAVSLPFCCRTAMIANNQRLRCLEPLRSIARLKYHTRRCDLSSHRPYTCVCRRTTRRLCCCRRHRCTPTCTNLRLRTA
jgi:hypothetical protein